jgi:hypothetical protein
LGLTRPAATDGPVRVGAGKGPHPLSQRKADLFFFHLHGDHQLPLASVQFQGAHPAKQRVHQLQLSPFTSHGCTSRSCTVHRQDEYNTRSRLVLAPRSLYARFQSRDVQVQCAGAATATHDGKSRRARSACFVFNLPYPSTDQQNDERASRTRISTRPQYYYLL